MHRVVAWSLLSIPGRPSFLTTDLQLPLRESGDFQTGARQLRRVLESPLLVLLAATPKERPPTQPTSRSSRSPPRRPGRTTPDPGNRAPSGIDAWPSGNSPISP